MRSPLTLTLVLCAPLGLTSCNNEDPEALYIDVLYQLRCLDCEPRTNDGPVREVRELDGENGFQLSCASSSAEDGTLVNFSLEYKDPKDEDKDFSLVVQQAGLDDTAHGAACSLKVSDRGSTYEGKCASGEVTTSRPCDIDLTREGDIIRGTLDCDRIPIQDMMTPIRYFKKPNSDEPAEIEIRGCSF